MYESYKAGENVALDKSLELSKKIAQLGKKYKNEKNYILINHITQISRSSSSVSANLAEIVSTLSFKYKISKINIALGECRETRIWLEIMQYNEMISDDDYSYLIGLCDDICRILYATVHTLQQKQRETEKKASKK